MSYIDVIIEDLKEHPLCPHGPTVLFSRTNSKNSRRFFACSAYRDRKQCPFFLLEDEKQKFNEEKQQIWDVQKNEFLSKLSHGKRFKLFEKLKAKSAKERHYCHSCDCFLEDLELEEHKDHIVTNNCNDTFLQHPTTVLPSLSNAKEEAQFFFSPTTIQTILSILNDLNVSDVLTIGAPSIYEHIHNQKNCFLLDIDKRFHNFYPPSQFAWYNLFNHHFFTTKAQKSFELFLRNTSKKNYMIILDPPFGGRVELIAETLRKINEKYNELNDVEEQLKVFWFYPYFNESHILNSLPNFHMLDFKVNYKNHPLFQSGKKGRKEGSPVRIFTNVDPSLVRLPTSEGYKYCKICTKWVSAENKHCSKCNKCTSKNGSTYKHCSMCNKCVKSTWIHCNQCNKCNLPKHLCEKVEFMKVCFHCQQVGHKRIDCPNPVKKKKINCN